MTQVNPLKTTKTFVYIYNYRFIDVVNAYSDVASFASVERLFHNFAPLYLKLFSKIVSFWVWRNQISSSASQIIIF